MREGLDSKELEIWKDIFRGIKDGKRASCGPHTVQVDLTDKCNSTCIGCWVHSPLLDKKVVFPQGEKELPFNLVEELIEQLHRSGTKEIILSGSGEPLMYPGICEVIKLIKSSGMYLNIITNGTLFSERISKMLVEEGVDLITASIWAGGPKAYIDTHPGKSVKDFESVRKNLKRIAFYKQRYKSHFPYIKIYNVICIKNYHDIEAMADFAKDVDANSLEFQIIDIIRGKTDHLAIDRDLKENLLAIFKRITERKDFLRWGLEDIKEFENIKSNLREEDSGRIWKNYKKGFIVSEKGVDILCPKGNRLKKGDHLSIKVSPTHSQDIIFRFAFEEEKCRSCMDFTSCFPSKEYSIDIKILNILGIKSFIRRISSSEVESGIYEKQVNTLPCYIGWYYARILTNGDVIPCCKASSHSLGNIYKKSFDRIWNSSAYKEFRFKAKTLSKDNPYFSNINCIKSCDNWGMNLEINDKLKEKKVVILAKDFIAGNFNSENHNFGKGLIVDGGEKRGFARFEFIIDKEGSFELWSRYASGEPRPTDIYIDGELITKKGLSGATGGWTSRFLKWHEEFEIKLKEGKHILEISSSGYIPHIEKFAFFKKKQILPLIDKGEKINYFLFIKDYLSKKGLKETARKFKDVLNINNLRNRYLEILGVFDGQYGYKGPFHVQIDLTNNCNGQCIACWCNSPLLKEKRLSEDEKKQYIPLKLVKELLDEISFMGATEVYYSGGGEPFMHPHIMEVLEYTKRKGLTCHVNTNFTLLDKDKIDCLIDLGVDFLTVSIWAGSPQTYSRVHLGRTEEDFYRIKDNLIYLNKKKREKSKKPLIKIYDVLFNMNYFEVEEMIKFAESTHSESIEFTLADTIPNETDILRLNEEQAHELIGICKNIEKRLDKNNILPSGLFLFQFDQFLRRISVVKDVKEAKYDRNVIDRMPCYVGWLFARVVPNGKVHSCLKAHRIPTGSLYSDRFSEIWNSKNQARFRKKTLVYKKDGPFFRLIGNDPYTQETGCYKSCDDIGRNTWMHNKMKMLSMPERLVLKSVAKTSKIVRKIKPKRDNRKDYHKDPVIAGIIHGRKAFVGPEQVVIDPTNKCNLRCAACWLYSPCLSKDKPSYDWLKKELPKDRLIKLVDDLSSFGTKRVRFTGGGEPFLHKDLMEVIEYARKKGLLAAITTNFGLVSKKDIKRLVDLDLEELCISIWASNAKTYSVVHPDTSFVYFEKLKENLLYLKDIKNEKPRVTFANVIMNSNFKDFEGMYEFGLNYGGDTLYFTIVDVLSGQTDKFLLNEDERKELLEKALKIKERNKEDSIQLEFFDGFLRRISRKEEDFKKGEYDRVDVDKMPCYAGWIFARILADGSVTPCCRGVKNPIGNINKESFKDIWFSPKYNEFRAKAKYLSKSDSYFKDIGCIKECDNLMHNEEIHRKINAK